MIGPDLAAFVGLGWALAPLLIWLLASFQKRRPNLKSILVLVAIEAVVSTLYADSWRIFLSP